MARVKSLPCPHCGQSYRLTVEYLSRFGGRTTDCTSCQQPFVLPRVDEVFDAADRADAASSIVEYERSAEAQMSTYAGDPLDSTAWREGNHAVVARGPNCPSGVTCVTVRRPGCRSLSD